MGRPLRRQLPGQYYLFTTRCHQARFFLRPDPDLNRIVLEWLARSQRRFPRIRIHAVCVMSNHLHLVLRDDEGQLADWASHFLGNLARAVNRLRGRSGTFFERRYAAEPILDTEALHDRLVYVVTNPVKARLCERTSDWPGVVLFANGPQRHESSVSWVDRDALRNARGNAQRHSEALPQDPSFQVEGTLVVDPLPAIHESGAAAVRASVEAREQALAEERVRGKQRTLGPARIVAQSWHTAPESPKRSPRPLCHAVDPTLRAAFRSGFQSFVGLFREASELLRCGLFHVSFPEWSFPPGSPLVRAVGAHGGSPPAI